MERLSVFTALAITVALSLTLGAFGHAPTQTSQSSFSATSNHKERTTF